MSSTITTVNDDEFIEVRDLTSEIKITNPTPAFVGPYSHIIRGSYLNRMVAVKVIRDLGIPSRSMRRKMTREREVWADLRHPNILPLYGYTEGSELFGRYGALISPWLPFGDAGHYLARLGDSLSFEKRVNLWQGVLKGVDYLHNRTPDIVHGDLKPGNVLIDTQGIPQICDFGLIRIFMEEGHSGVTTTSPLTGTDRYLAPELLDTSDVKMLSPASDVYALGCTGLEFILREVPYRNRKHNIRWEIFNDMKDGIPPAVRPRETSAELGAIWEMLEACWRPEPDERVTTSTLLEWLAYTALADPDTQPEVPSAGHTENRARSPGARNTPSDIGTIFDAMSNSVFSWVDDSTNRRVSDGLISLMTGRISDRENV